MASNEQNELAHGKKNAFCMPIEGTIVAHNSQVRGSGKERTSINVNCDYDLLHSILPTAFIF